MKDLRKFIGNENITISEAMHLIDQNSCGILFFVDENDILRGCITDGDIRRHLLSGGDLTDLARKVLNKNPKVAKSEDEAKSLYHKRDFVIIPIVDTKGVLIDLYFGDNSIVSHPDLNTPVIINAGGKGSRLDPFTRVLPKPLIPIGELPIIEHIMKQYQSYNCNEFHIIVNYKKELMKAYFADIDDKYNITWYNEEKPLGTGGGLSLLKGKFDDTVIFANCDVLLTADYGELLEFHRNNRNDITMVCAYKNISIPYGVVEMGINGTIEGMKEKPLISFLTNTGIYIIEPQIINDVEDDVAIDFPDIIERERLKNKRVAVFPVSENDWMDMGQLPELEKMRIKLLGE